ncbi:MAG: protocatechuate 3,4-dioxygenase [Pseudomonadota bacterium]
MSLPALATKRRDRPMALTPTPGQILGPYYPLSPDPGADGDAARRPGAAHDPAGTKVRIEGHVLDTTGRPLPGVLVEIWQCDANGIYPHPKAPKSAQVDPDFEGYARCITAADGTYAFRALRPVSYPGRAPHIHVKVTAPGAEPLITQIYVEGEPENRDDFALLRATQPERAALIIPFRPVSGPDVQFAGRFDIVLDHRRQDPAGPRERRDADALPR